MQCTLMNQTAFWRKIVCLCIWNFWIPQNSVTCLKEEGDERRCKNKCIETMRLNSLDIIHLWEFIHVIWHLYWANCCRLGLIFYSLTSQSKRGWLLQNFRWRLPKDVWRVSRNLPASVHMKLSLKYIFYGYILEFDAVYVCLWLELYFCSMSCIYKFLYPSSLMKL